MKIVEYEVVESYLSKEDFVDNAKHMIADGWQPFGGISTSDNEGFRYFIQAFVKYEQPLAAAEAFLDGVEGKPK